MRSCFVFQLDLVGIGMGNPDHLTQAAITALQSADLILVPHKGESKTLLSDLRMAICQKYLGSTSHVIGFEQPPRDPKIADYLTRVEAWHDGTAQIWSSILKEHLPKGGRAALLIWGDPSLYDSSLRIADRLQTRFDQIDVSVHPGLTAIQLLTAAHRIPLNTLGAPVMISTGRQLVKNGFPNESDTLVVMLDGELAFQTLAPDPFDIWWGAYLGMKEEILIKGRLKDVSALISEQRVKARQKYGWIMDTYLLRRVLTSDH